MEIMYVCDKFDRKDLRDIAVINKIDLPGIREEVKNKIMSEVPEDAWTEEFIDDRLDYWCRPF